MTIILGPVFQPDLDDVVSYQVVGENQVAVPTGFFKIVVDPDAPAGVDALAFIIPNRSLFGQRYEQFLVSIDEIEAATGIDFLSELPDDQEAALEARVPNDVWQTTEGLAEADRAVLPTTDYDLLVLAEDGRVADPAELDRIQHRLVQGETTHLILFAHGWNNSLSDARASYAAILDEMDQIAKGPQSGSIVPEPFRPMVVGLHWPSKAWDEESGSLRSASADDDLTMAICKVLPAERSPDTYLEDVLRLRELLNKPASELSPQDVETAWEIFGRYSIPPQEPEEASIFDALPGERAAGPVASGAFSGWSVRDLFRVFTFWQMKKRAGIVGRSGAREILRVLMAAAPEVQVHVIGHSFGCKVWLSAVSAPHPAPSRPLDSVVLLQGAISAYAFAEQVPRTERPGGYRSALDRTRVRGPIIATFSSQDTPLNWAYPLGSRLAGQTGELERAAEEERPSRFSALGAVGAVDAGSAAHQTPMNRPPTRYQLTPGLWSVNGNELIVGHSEIYTVDVAWLVWAAITSQ